MKQLDRNAIEKEYWFRDLDERLGDIDYPLDRNTAEDKLRGLNTSRFFDDIDWPVSSREDFESKLRRARESR